MTILHFARRMVERVTGTHIFRHIPQGTDLARDMAVLLPGYRMEIIFDVGAHRGQSAKRFLQEFPEARVHCFEPAGETFRRLEDRLGHNRRVTCHRLAFGARKETGRLVVRDNASMSYLVDPARERDGDSETRTESVAVTTVDQFCRETSIDRISYLKVDTEGYDLEVLNGATDLLSRQRIDLVEVEAGMNPENHWHVPWESLNRLLASFTYSLFSIYQQQHEWPTGAPHLRRSNPVYISQQMIERHTLPPGRAT